MKHLLLITALLAALAGCSSTKKHEEKRPMRAPQENVVENARKNVAWQGTYQGILPCSACEGVATMIVLNPDMTYTTRTRMLGIDDKDGKHLGPAQPFVDGGRFGSLSDLDHLGGRIPG